MSEDRMKPLAVIVEAVLKTSFSSEYKELLSCSHLESGITPIVADEIVAKYRTFAADAENVERLCFSLGKDLKAEKEKNATLQQQLAERGLVQTTSSVYNIAMTMKEKELRKIADRKQTRIDSLQRQIVSLKESHENDMAESDNEIQELQDKIEFLIVSNSSKSESNTDTEIEKWKSSYFDEVSRNKTSTSKISEQKKIIRSLESDIAHIKDESEKARLELIEKHRKSIAEYLTDMQNRADSHTLEIKSLQDTMQATVLEKESMISALETKLDSLQDKAVRSKEELEAACMKWRQLYEHEIDQQEASEAIIFDKTKRIVELEKHIKSVTMGGECRESILELNYRSESMKWKSLYENECDQNESVAGEMLEMKKQMKILNKKVKELNAALRAAERADEEKARLISAYEDDKCNLSSAVDDEKSQMSNDVVKWKGLFEDEKENNERIGVTLASQRQEGIALQQQLMSMEQVELNLNKEITKWKSLHEEVAGKLELQSAVISEKDKMINALKKNSENISDRHQGEIADLTSRINDISAAFEASKTTLNADILKWRSLYENECEQSEKDSAVLMEKQKQVKTLEKSIKNLSAMVTNLEKEVEEKEKYSREIMKLQEVIDVETAKCTEYLNSSSKYKLLYENEVDLNETKEKALVVQRKRIKELEKDALARLEIVAKFNAEAFENSVIHTSEDQECKQRHEDFLSQSSGFPKQIVSGNSSGSHFDCNTVMTTVEANTPADTRIQMLAAENERLHSVISKKEEEIGNLLSKLAAIEESAGGENNDENWDNKMPQTIVPAENCEGQQISQHVTFKSSSGTAVHDFRMLDDEGNVLMLADYLETELARLTEEHEKELYALRKTIKILQLRGNAQNGGSVLNESQSPKIKQLEYELEVLAKECKQMSATYEAQIKTMTLDLKRVTKARDSLIDEKRRILLEQDDQLATHSATIAAMRKTHTEALQKQRLADKEENEKEVLKLLFFMRESAQKENLKTQQRIKNLEMMMKAAQKVHDEEIKKLISSYEEKLRSCQRQESLDGDHDHIPPATIRLSSEKNECSGDMFSEIKSLKISHEVELMKAEEAWNSMSENYSKEIESLKTNDVRNQEQIMRLQTEVNLLQRKNDISAFKLLCADVASGVIGLCCDKVHHATLECKARVTTSYSIGFEERIAALKSSYEEELEEVHDNYAHIVDDLKGEIMELQKSVVQGESDLQIMRGFHQQDLNSAHEKILDLENSISSIKQSYESELQDAANVLLQQRQALKEEIEYVSDEYLSRENMYKRVLKILQPLVRTNIDTHDVSQVDIVCLNNEVEAFVEKPFAQSMSFINEDSAIKSDFMSHGNIDKESMEFMAFKNGAHFENVVTAVDGKAKCVDFFMKKPLESESRDDPTNVNANAPSCSDTVFKEQKERNESEPLTMESLPVCDERVNEHKSEPDFCDVVSCVEHPSSAISVSSSNSGQKGKKKKSKRKKK